VTTKLDVESITWIPCGTAVDQVVDRHVIQSHRVLGHATLADDGCVEVTPCVLDRGVADLRSARRALQEFEAIPASSVLKPDWEVSVIGSCAVPFATSLPEPDSPT